MSYCLICKQSNTIIIRLNNIFHICNVCNIKNRLQFSLVIIKYIYWNNVMNLKSHITHNYPP